MLIILNTHWYSENYIGNRTANISYKAYAFAPDVVTTYSNKHMLYGSSHLSQTYFPLSSHIIITYLSFLLLNWVGFILIFFWTKGMKLQILIQQIFLERWKMHIESLFVLSLPRHFACFFLFLVGLFCSVFFSGHIPFS